METAVNSFLPLFDFNFATYIFSIIGFYAVLIYLIDNLTSLVMIAKAILMPFFQPKVKNTLTEKFGSWAVVTGATDGIGKEYCNQLAIRGVNIVLISRSEEKLIQCANEIESQYRVKTKTITADFSKGKEIYEHIKNQLAGIPVGILVNNVGRMYDSPDELGNIDEKFLFDMVNINMTSCTMMSRMLVNHMKKNGKGAIVNISSGSELQALPLMAVYGASKRYVRNFSIALQHELSPYGVTVQLVTPLFVVTKMNNYSKQVMQGGIMFPDVKSYTRSLVFTLGKTNVTTGYWSHAVQYAAMKIVPESIRIYFGKRLNKIFMEEYNDERIKAKQI